MNSTRRAEHQLEVFATLLEWILPAARRESRFSAQLQTRLARDRRFGSSDRRFYRALAYSAVRFLPWLEAAPPGVRAHLALWLASGEPALAPVRDTLLTDWPATPEMPAERAIVLAAHLGMAFSGDDLVPPWFSAECPALSAPTTQATLLTRPPLWLRLQRAAAATVLDWLRTEQLPFRRSTVMPEAVAVLTETDLTSTELFRAGALEIQDLGSQLVLALADPVSGSHWLDACAGAGGKTLQLAELVGPAGRVTATDIRAEALAELKTRTSRAGLGNVSIAPAVPPDATFDGVLVDAPCSGSGTWRRHPHLKWQTTAADLRRHAARQLVILTENASRVRPGGHLVYATCSLARTENEDVAGAILAAHPNFRVVPPAEARGCAVGEFGTAILPHVHDTDGFFVSVLERRN